MIFTALLLGIIEGMTEFLPVSSTGHLILFGQLLGFDSPAGKTFEIVIQLGAICAICCLYRKKLAAVATGMARGNRADWRFTAGLLVALMPALIIGMAFHGFIRDVLFNPVNVSVMLIAGGVIILIVERFPRVPRVVAMEEISLPLCLKIGLCQCLALMPGTSRSGATIIGAMLLGVERKAATEFSFFLAIPTMLAATIFSLAMHWHEMSVDDLGLIAVGFAAAFASALVVVRALVAYIATHGFAPFGWYRIALGLVMLMLIPA